MKGPETQHLTEFRTASMFGATKAQAAVSAAKKAVPGFAACRYLRRPQPRQNERGFSVFAVHWAAPMGRAFGATSVGRFRKGGTANSVRPARHICRTAGRVHSNLTEATL